MKVEGFVVEICQISPADIVEVKRVEGECSLSPWSINDYYAETQRLDSIALIAKVKGKIVGFMIARLIKKTNKTPLYEIEIYNICVTHKHRRKGIGNLFLQKLFESAENKIASVWLEVRESNKGAISFYRHLGFKATGIRKNFYCNPIENGLIMKKSLD